MDESDGQHLANEWPAPPAGGSATVTREDALRMVWPCKTCRDARRRCKGGCPCVRCFSSYARCVDASVVESTAGASSSSSSSSSVLDLIFAATDCQMHASMFFDAVTRLAGQGRCSQMRALTVLDAWRRLSVAAGGRDVTYGLAQSVRALLGIDACQTPDIQTSQSPNGRPADRSQKEQEWLLACGKELEARASPRWNSALESGAILCEELRNDRLSLAGNRRFGVLLRDGPSLLAAAVQHGALPSLLLGSLIEQDYRQQWYDSLAYMTFSDGRATPRTLVCKVADKDAAIGLFIVTLQRFDISDGGFVVIHRLETAPESRYVMPHPSQHRMAPIVRFADPLDAFIERQQFLAMRGKVHAPSSDSGLTDDCSEGDGWMAAVLAAGGLSSLLSEEELLEPDQKQEPAPSLTGQQPQQHDQQVLAGEEDSKARHGPAPGAAVAAPPSDPLVFRGLAVLPLSLGMPPNCIAAMEQRLSTMSAADVRAIFEPPSLHLLQTLCPWEYERGGGPPPS